MITQNWRGRFQVIMIRSTEDRDKIIESNGVRGSLTDLFTVFEALNHNEPDRSTDKWWTTCHALLNDEGIKMRTGGLAYPSLRLSPTGAGLTDILGWVEMEHCDWLLEKDDVSRLTGDIGGVGLLHSECEREPGMAEETNCQVVYSCSIH